MVKQYIGSDEHWIDSVNQRHDEDEERDRQQQKEIDKQINEQSNKQSNRNMQFYTIGIYFNEDLTEVLLILKNRPLWQINKYNFPGGHIEYLESQRECVSREFKEECGLITDPSDWNAIGFMSNPNNYVVYILTITHKPEYGTPKMGEDQPIQWFKINELPENIIPNLRWLIPFAKNTYDKNPLLDSLKFGRFTYED